MNTAIKESLVDGDINPNNLGDVNTALRSLISTMNSLTSSINVACGSGPCILCSDVNDLIAAINELAKNKKTLARTVTPLNGSTAKLLKGYSNGPAGVVQGLKELAEVLAILSQKLSSLGCTSVISVRLANAFGNLSDSEEALAASLIIPS